MADYSIYTLMSSKIFLAVFFSWLLAQVIKAVVRVRQKKNVSLSRFVFEMGGFPSSHASSVWALALSIFLIDGFSSLFFLAFVFAVITLRDASGVRLEASNHAKILNKFLKKFKTKKKLNERVGHSAVEVFAGCILATIVTTLVFLI